MIILLDYFVSWFVRGVVFRREAQHLTGCRSVQRDSATVRPRLCFLWIADDGRCPETSQFLRALRTILTALQKCRRGSRSRLL